MATASSRNNYAGSTSRIAVGSQAPMKGVGHEGDWVVTTRNQTRVM